MKRLIISSSSILLVIAATSPAWACGKLQNSNTQANQSVAPSSSIQPSAQTYTTTQSNKRTLQRSSNSPVVDPKNTPVEVPSPSLIKLGV